MYFFSKGILGAAIITLVSSVEHNNVTKPQNNSPGLAIITSLIQQFISPKPGSGISIRTRSKPSTIREGTIEWAIQNKVAQLKSYLQDDDNILEDKEEETIIIEFLPKNNNAGKGNLRSPNNDSHYQDLKNSKNEFTKRANITGDDADAVPHEKAKFLKVREKIKSQLEKEAVSGETVDYILKKVDYLIERLIKSDCTLKSSDTNKLRSPDQSVHFSVKWTKRWEDLKKRYFSVMKDPDSLNKDMDSKLTNAMEEYGKFFSSIIEDVNLMSSVYSLQCKLIKKNSDAQRRKTNDISKLCKNFRICSSELGIFFNDFYFTLNHTVIDAIKNYAAMYSVDVAADENESDDDVASTIKQFVEKAKKTIRKIFETELGKFSLDKHKDSATNMDMIKTFVNITLQSLKSNMKKNIERTLDRHSDVKDDLYQNLNSEIDEYSRIAQTKICKSFQTCNGNGRRSFGYKSKVEGSDVYVNVRVGINDEKNILTNGRRRFVNDDKYQSTVRSRYIPYKSRLNNRRNARKRQMNVTIVEDNSPVPIKLHNFRSKINLKSLRRKEAMRRSGKINKEFNDKSDEGLVIPLEEDNNITGVPTPTTLASNDLLTSKLAFKAHFSIDNDKENALMDLVRKLKKPNDL